MAHNGYVGVNNNAHLIDIMYIGVNGVARKIKKVYIGVNEIARLWYEYRMRAVEFKEYSGSGKKRYQLQGSARAGNYAIFAGGKTISSSISGSGTESTSTIVEAFSRTMTKVSAPSLTWEKNNGVGLTIGNNAFFAGGWNNRGKSGDEVTMYTPSLTKSFADSLYAQCGSQLTTKAGDYGIIAGGWRTLFLDSTYLASACAWSSSGTSQNIEPLKSATQCGALSAYVGGKGLMIRYDTNTTAEVYNKSLTQSTFNAGVISNPGIYVASASNSDYAMVYSMSNGYTYLINPSLTITSINTNLGSGDSGIVKKNAQANYLAKQTKQTPNGSFIVYGMKDGSIPQYIILDGKKGTVIQYSGFPSSIVSDYERECVGSVNFDDIVVMYNGYTGKPIFYKPTAY